ncbi:MAG: ATP-binding protein [Anaerolineae bacterium]
MMRVFKSLSRWLGSLQAQLILWAILPMTLVLVALALTGVYSHERAMRDFVVERNRVVAPLLARNLVDAVAHGYVTPDGRNLTPWLEQQALTLPGTVTLLDANGDVLASVPATREARLDAILPLEKLRTPPPSENGVTSFVVNNTPDGPVLVTVTPVQELGWSVVLHEPVQQVVGPILRFASLGPIVAVIATALSLLILTFGWRTIMRPLQQLSQAAAHVSWGDHQAIEREIGGVVEIRELHKTLHEMVERIESYEAGVRDYLEAVTQGQEAERARLAREIHDGPVQSLIAMSQRCEMARQRVEKGETAAARTLLDELRATELSIIEELRRIVGALRPIYLEDLGFLPALEMLVRRANARSAAEIRLKVGEAPRRLCPTAELAIYRITQEALNNAQRHAQAQQIVVSVTWNDAGVTLTISDDGIGFELAERLNTYTQQGHFGLVGLQERVRQLKGTLHIETAPGEGTTVTARLPDCREAGACPT